MIPLYNAAMPPSVRYMMIMVAHIPGSFFGLEASWAKDADWMDSLVRTISKGYVNVTDVMPAKPPQSNLVRGGMSAPGYSSKKV